MPHWLIKAAVQRGISFLPRSHFWNEMFQKHVTKSVELTLPAFETRLNFCRRHFELFSKWRVDSKPGFTALELGTGWFPTIPIGLYLCGASTIWTYDIAPFLSAKRLSDLLKMFFDSSARGELQKVLPNILPERMEHLRAVADKVSLESPETFLMRLNIHCRVQDAQSTNLEAQSVDFIFSNGVLEYIPREVLANILSEFKRVGTANVVTSHYINLRDVYSYFDTSITPFNYLKFSDRAWKYLNSPLTWQNRLRITDYRELFAKAGFSVVEESNTSGAIEDLEKVYLASRFKNYSRQDLLVIFSLLAAIPAVLSEQQSLRQTIRV